MEHEEAEALPVTLHANPAPGRSSGAAVPFLLQRRVIGVKGRNRCLVVVLAVSVVLAVASRSGVGAGPGASGEMVNGAPIITVLPKDAIPAIDDPKFVPAKEADRLMKPEEPVLGMTDGTVTKAYSLWQLNRHEIVNDWIGKLPVAVTW